MVFWALQKVQGRGIILLLGRASLPSVPVLEEMLVGSWLPKKTPSGGSRQRPHLRCVKCLISGTLSLHTLFIHLFTLHLFCFRCYAWPINKEDVLSALEKLVIQKENRQVSEKF